MSWIDQLPGCFAFQTAPFGLHKNDEDRAREMFKAAVKAGVSFADVEREIRAYLSKAQGWPVDVEKEIARARAFSLRYGL
jgi:hypothetical protein